MTSAAGAAAAAAGAAALASLPDPFASAPHAAERALGGGIPASPSQVQFSQFTPVQLPFSAYLCHAGTLDMALFICKYANEDLVARLAGQVATSEYRVKGTYVSTMEGTRRIDVRCPHEEMDASIANFTAFLLQCLFREGYELRAATSHRSTYLAAQRTAHFLYFYPLPWQLMNLQLTREK